MTSAEHIAMLNGRMAAVQAATADLLERGALRPNGDRDIIAGPAVPGMTDLQSAIHRAVAKGTLHIDRDPDVIAQLDLLQRDCVRRGLLHPPHKGDGSSTVIGTLVGACVAFMMFRWIGAPKAMLVVPFGIAAFVILRSVLTSRRGKDRRTKVGIEALQQARAHTSTRDALGAQVGAFGTRPLMIAFPAAAVLGWAITDFEDPLAQAQRMMGTGSGGGDYVGASSGGGDSWCSGGNTCGSGGSCNSGSCSSGGCGGGSSCGGGCSS